jgi:Zn finger protein HypA/HybF involved in hydrogenase expression
MEPAFYKCKSCGRTWERMEFKIRANPPKECPNCKSLDQDVDREKEDRYVSEIYGPITKMIVDK